METVTACLAILAVAFAISSRPGTAFGILIFSALAWPEFLRFPIGLIQMSIPRTIALAVVLRGVFAHRRYFRFTTPDGLILALWAWTVFAQIAAGASFRSVSTTIGQGLDTALIYFAARLTLQTLDDLKDSVPLVALTSIVAGPFGVVEALTSWSPWDYLDKYKSFVVFDFDKATQFRLGLKRASGSASVYIHFGVAMCLLLAMQVALFRLMGNRTRLIKIGIFASSLGVVSSLSSGPWLMLLVFVGLFVFFRFPALIKPSLWLILIGLIFVEAISNRHFYQVIDYFTLDKSTAWYRARLIEVAFEHLDEWWLVGTGDDPLFHWAAALDGRGHLDIVNQYIWIGVNGGLPAMFCFIIIQIKCLRNCLALFRSGIHRTTHLGFANAAIIIALMFCMNTVSLFGPALIYSFALYGMLPRFSRLGVRGECSVQVFSDPRQDYK